MATKTAARAGQSVTVDNFKRAESDMDFARSVIRMNRDTLYSSGVFGCGGNPPSAARCVSVMPSRSNGKTRSELTVKDVPVDAFWSLSVYNAKGTPNCLPIVTGWSYTVQTYRPRKPILDGTWTFPEAQPVE